MDTSSRQATGVAARWKYITNGYNSWWWLRNTLRWILVIIAFTALIAFGAIWDEMGDTNQTDWGMGLSAFFIAAPLFSLVISIAAIVNLFALRKKIFISPAWPLSGDIIAILVFVVDLTFNEYQISYWKTPSQYYNPRSQLVITWALNMTSMGLHLVSMCLGAWEVNAYRGVLREARNSNGKEDAFEDIELQSRQQQQQQVPSNASITTSVMPLVNAPGTPTTFQTNRTPSTAAVEMPNNLRIELPDGRILELPAGSHVELPSSKPRSELPGQQPLRLSIADPAELETISPASLNSGAWSRSPVGTLPEYGSDVKPAY